MGLMFAHDDQIKTSRWYIAHDSLGQLHSGQEHSGKNRKIFRILWLSLMKNSTLQPIIWHYLSIVRKPLTLHAPASGTER